MREQEYIDPTPIQQQAIPHLLAGRDLLGAAQTGTGKTAAFMLPLLQRLCERRAQSDDAAAPHAHGRNPSRRPLRALILAPTRELAIQVEQSARTYGRHLNLRSAAIYGGVGMQPQIDALRRGADLVVATPGRLLDHLSQRTIVLSQIDHVVLDEADRMLDMGFIHDVRRVLSALPRERQTLLFSATFSAEIRRLADAFLRDPVAVQVAAANATVDLVTQTAHPVAQDAKRALLAFLIRQRSWPQLLVFTRTKHGANRLAEQLSKDGIPADAIHGNKSQNQRMRALGRFKALEVSVLVATDIAARGIDIAELPCVVNFDLPHVPEDYVHRIGRTARAGASGEAISLVSREELPLLAAIESFIGQKIERHAVDGFAMTTRPPQAPAQKSGRPQGAPRKAAPPAKPAPVQRGSRSAGTQAKPAPLRREARNAKPAAKRSAPARNDQSAVSSGSATGLLSGRRRMPAVPALLKTRAPKELSDSN